MHPPVALSPERREFYRDVLDSLSDALIPFLVGGSSAWTHYTGAGRETKDFDLFLIEADAHRAIELLRHKGYRAVLVFTHWLAKVHHGEHYIDLIFNSGNGLCPVDALWFRHADAGVMFGKDVLICPVEEMIWQKAFIMERERFDGGDVAHLLRAYADRLDWRRLRARFRGHWRVLLAHLVLFGFIYPGARDKIPREIFLELLERCGTEQETLPADDMTCQGTLLSRAQYVIDLEHWGYRDPRLPPAGVMTESQVADWSDAMHSDAGVIVPFLEAGVGQTMDTEPGPRGPSRNSA
jgi:hypothetical protein